ncbi:MAG TPA: hypothetical protein PKX00_07800 [Opitutaceae bacterium]|jgi:hypothetical protein|nr:hypothetical protein [Opitutaceae bacterium]HRE05495.1 hypothetical protein [Opitutaceae bacterium]
MRVRCHPRWPSARLYDATTVAVTGGAAAGSARSPAAAQAAKLRFDLEKIGLKIGPYDLLIAGHARGTRRTLVTHNTREFVRVTGLPCLDWRQ